MCSDLRHETDNLRVDHQRYTACFAFLQIGFYDSPNMDDLQNMTWFDNMGETSAEKTILLNLTQVISLYDEKELVGEFATHVVVIIL